MSKKYDVVIIGGGIIGSNILYYLSKLNLNILLVEKNQQFAQETSKNNSGVIHGGFDANENSINAKLNIKGKKLWENEIFNCLDFPKKKIDSIVLAFNELEIEQLEILYKRGLKNGVNPNDLFILNNQELIKQHPLLNTKVLKALVCKNTWVIDPVKAANAFISNSINEKNIQIKLNTKIIKLEYKNNLWHLTTNNNEEIISKNIINVAGHHADVIAHLAKVDDFKLKARRGQYLIIKQDEIYKDLNGIYFMVPTIYGKGVIVAPTLNSTILVGPTSEENIKKEDISKTTSKMLSLIPQIGKKIIPNLNFEKVISNMAGSRPIDIETNDFIIRYSKKNKYFINVAGTKSPGLSASPAIAQMVISLLVQNGTVIE